MAKTVAFEVEVNSGNSVKTLDSLKKELEGINAELEQAEIGSAAFTKLSDASRKTASEIKTLNKTFEGLEPQQKTEAFLKGFEAISGAVAVTVGTLAIFGVESEAAGKIEQKVQGAIAIAIGARAIAEGALQARIAARLVAEKAATIATQAATAAQAAFNFVLNLNPIFLLVTVLAAVTAGMYLFSKSMGDNTENVKKNNEALLRRNQLLEDSAGFQVRVAQATGQSATVVKEAQIEQTKATLATLEAEYKLAKAGEDKMNLATKIKESQDNLIIQELELGKIKQDEVDAEKKRLADAQKVRTDNAAKDKAEKDRVAKEKAAEVKAETERKALEDAAKFKAEQDYLDKVNTLLQTENDKKILSVAKTYDDLIEQAAQFGADTSALEAARGVAIQAVLDEQANERLEKQKAADEKAAAATKVITDAQEVKDKAIADANKFAQDANIANVQATIGALGSLFEEGTAGAKVAALADIAIGTGLGFVQGLDIAQKSAKATGPAAAFAFPLFYAAQIASVLAAANQAKKILQTVPGGGGGGATPSKPNIQTPSNNFIPVGQQPAGTQLTPSFGSVTTPVRAFVISGDVSDGLEASARLRNRRTLGG
jgi:hypothetical protein